MQTEPWNTILYTKDIFIFNWFILIVDWLLYNIVMAFAIHWHESVMGVHVQPKTFFNVFTEVKKALY